MLIYLLSIIISLSPILVESIIGGTPASKQFPYFVNLQVERKNGQIYQCGGTLIKPDVVLTAGNCFSPSTDAKVTAIVNATTQVRNPTGFETKLGAIRYIYHPDFVRSELGDSPNDIMLIRLERNVPRASVPDLNDNTAIPPDLSTVKMIGLGITKVGVAVQPNTLQEVQINVVPTVTCQAQYKGTDIDGVVKDRLSICAQAPGGGKDMCYGDLGGPLVRQRSGRPDLMLGVASSGLGCGLPNYSGVYVRISGYKDWIDEQLCLLDPSYCPAPAPAPAPFFVCFSGANTVEVHDKGTILMKDLRLGDQVKVADNSFQPVYSFGHYEQKETGQYVHIKAENMQPLEISKDHMLLVSGRGYVPASSVVVGDSLVSGEAGLVKVTSIRSKTSTGVFAPFTPSGTIVVNNIVASSYVTFQEDSGVVMIGGRSTGLTYQWLAQSCLLPGRLLGHYFGPFGVSDGIAGWVSVPHSFGVWWVNQHAVVMGLLLIPLLLIAGTFSLVESFGLCGMLAMMAVVVSARRFKMFVKTKRE